jgi:polyisoprenoid-binding protein YceI
MKARTAFLGAILALALGAGVRAEPYVVDKSHAAMTFMANHLGFSVVHGVFRDFDAQIDFDPQAVERTRVRFVVRTESVETFWPARDADLRGPNFFDVERFPEMVFESTSVSPTGRDTAEIKGNLTLRGITRPITLEAKLNKLGPSPFNPRLEIAGFTVTGQVRRTDFGMNFAAPAIGAMIPIRVDLEMSPAR